MKGQIKEKLDDRIELIRLLRGVSLPSTAEKAHFRVRALGLLFASALLILGSSLLADQVPVRRTEGRVHGFLVLRDLDDKILASGDLSQLADGNRVTTELSFQFKDGSVHQETAVYSQRRTFQLLTYHLVQKGPTFKRPLDMSLQGSTGQFTIRYTDDDGKEKTITDRLKLPTDLANGFVEQRDDRIRCRSRSHRIRS